ncbi:fructose-bisphosphatase class II [Micromonospora sp. NPDC049836]|uniref:fructose-bisphosphatase class II n=1 Tax=Micromonospora sp. NPDC049836 TaxID=3364274 RepID=UPI0037997A27
MVEANQDLHEVIRPLDERIVEVRARVLRESAEGGPPAPVTERSALIAAMSAAALAAANADAAQVPVALGKTRVDGAATAAAEAVFRRSALQIRVTAGEGERDGSPGASSGQTLGRQAGADGAVDGVFDYVDGTTLAVLGEPGALALGGLGSGLRSVPDLSAYAVLAPHLILPELDVLTTPEAHALPILRRIADAAGKPLDTLTVFTHSIAEKPLHRTLVDLMRPAVGRVIVPPLVTIEPPYLLSLAGLAEPRIDAMIGSIGLSELAFAALLLDLVAPEHGFVFRVASMAGPRRHPASVTLDPLFAFNAEEEQQFAAHGWRTDRQYTSADLVPAGSARLAAIFAVTDEPMLRLTGASQPSGGRTQGLLLEPGGQVTRIDVHYR